MKAIPREAHSPATNSASIRKMRESIYLSSLQKNILIGSLLGDGCLVANSWKKGYRLKIEHSLKQKNYLWWKYNFFENFVLSEPKFQKRNNSFSFRTITHPDFTLFRRTFYEDGVKIIPENINEILVDPLAIAIWYMDDGMLNTRKDTFLLNTQSFSKKDNLKLQKCLKENFDVEATLVRNKSYWMLYIKKSSALAFWKLVKNHATEIMSEKCL